MNAQTIEFLAGVGSGEIKDGVKLAQLVFDIGNLELNEAMSAYQFMLFPGFKKEGEVIADLKRVIYRRMRFLYLKDGMDKSIGKVLSSATGADYRDDQFD